MADSKFALRGAVSSPRSSPPNCAICLGACSNKCYSDSCMHEFCFTCLLEWSKIKAECPLCKQTFKSIIHNIKSLEEYDEHIVENTITVEENHYNLEANNIMQLLRSTPPLTALHHQYHFRTTLTVDTHGEHAIQQMLLSHPLLLGAYPPQRYPRRHRNETPASFRRSVYEDNLWVHSPPDITGRYREATPDYYRRNQTARTRLVPWLNRELNVLLHNNTQQVMLLVDIIMDNLLQIHICSASFRRLLREHLHDKADHFIHEFYNFMRSPLDMIGYDRHVIYTGRPQSPLPDVDNVPQIDISDYDSDVVLVDLTSSTTNTNNNNEDAPLQDGGAAVIDLVETDSDEPILISEEQNLSYDSHLDVAGPSTSSGITNAPRRLTDYVKKQDDDDTSTLTNDSDNNDISTSGLGASASADNNHNSGVLNREQRCLMPVKMRFKNTKSTAEFLDNSATTSLNIDNNNSDEDRISPWPPRRNSGGRRLKIHGGKNLQTIRRQLREAQRKRTAAYLAATASTSGGPSSSRLGRQADLDSIFTSPEDSSDDSDSDPSFSDSSTSSMSSSSSGSEYRRNYRHKKLKKPSSSAASQSRNKRKNKRTPTKKDDTNNNTTGSSSGRKKDKRSKSSSHKSRTSSGNKKTGARKRLRTRKSDRSSSDSDSDNDSSRSCHKSNNDRDSDVPLSNLAAGCSTVNNRRKRKCEPIKKSAAKRAKKQETTVPTESVAIATTSTTTTRNNNPGTSDNVDGIINQFLAVANRNSPEKITVLSESSSCSSDSPLINYYVPPPPQPSGYVEPSTNLQPSSFSKLIRSSPQPSSSQNNNVGSNNNCGNFAVDGDVTSGVVALNNTLPSGGLYRHHNMPLSSGGGGGFWQQFIEHGHGSNNNNNNNTSSSLYAVDSFSSNLPTPYFNPATLSAVANYHSNNNIPTALPTTFLDRHGNPRHHHHFNNNNNNNNNVVNNNLVVNSNNNNNNNNGCYSNLPAINLACRSNQPMSTTISITQRNNNSNNNNNNGTLPISTTPPLMEGGRNIVPQNFLANFYVNNTQNDSSSNGPNQSGEIRSRNLFEEIRAEMRAADDQSRAAARFEGTSGYFDRRNLPEIFDSARERQLQNDEQKRQRQQQNDNNDSRLCREISDDDDDGNSRGSCSSHASSSDSSEYKEYSKPNVKSRVEKPQQPQSQLEKDGVKSSAEFLQNSQKKYRKGASRTDLAGSTGDGRKSSGGAARKSSKSGATNSTKNINNNNRNSDENIDDKKSGTHSTKNKNNDENNHENISNSVDDEKTDCHKSNSDKLAASSSASKADRASDGASCSGPSKSGCEAPFPGASTSTRLRTVLKKEGSGFWYSRPPAVNHDEDDDDDDDSGEDSDYQIVCH